MSTGLTVRRWRQSRSGSCSSSAASPANSTLSTPRCSPSAATAPARGSARFRCAVPGPAAAPTEVMSSSELDVARVLSEAVKESAEQASRPHDALLDVEGVTVRFGGVTANSDVSIWCRDATITALLGPNGAGKSTLFDVITGARKPDSGRLVFDGQDVSGAPVHVRARLGMGRTFQNLAVVRDMSVVENVMLGASRFRSYGIIPALLGLPRVRRTDRAL